MQDTTISRLVEQAATGHRLREAARADGTGKTCPTHEIRLDGGPVQYHCPAGHGVMAADLNHEHGADQ